MVDPHISLEEPEPDLDEPNIRRRSSPPPDQHSTTPAPAFAVPPLASPGRVQSHDYAVAIATPASLINEKNAEDALATKVTPTSSNESGYASEKAVGPDTLLARAAAPALNPGFAPGNLSNSPHRHGVEPEAPHTGPLGGEKEKVRIIEPTWKQSWVNAIKGAPILCAIPVLLPIAWALHLSHQNPIAVFVTSLLCIVPLAAGLGFATEELALRIGEAWGGLLNATFGNVTELLIAIIALVHGEIEIVQAAMIGSILSNLLLVLGMSYFAGGLRFHEQMYFIPAAQMQISLLGLTIMAIALPAAFHWAYPSTNSSAERFGSVLEGEELQVILRFSRGLSFILLATYAMFLCFQLWTHAYLFRLPRTSNRHDHPEGPMPSSDRVFPVPDWVPSLADSSSSGSSISSGRSGHTARSNNPFKKFRRWSTSRSNAPQSPAAVDLERQDSSDMARVRFDESDTRPVSPASLGPAAVGGQIYEEPEEHHNLPESDSSATAPAGATGLKGILRPRLPAKIASAKLPLPAMPRIPRAPENEDDGDADPIEPQVRWYFALGMLLLMTVLAGVSAEFLVDSIDGLVSEGNVSRQFVGLILLPVIGNAVEHVTAVTVSVKDKLNLSMSIAVGSSIQVSLCILPILVLIGWAIGQPLTLYFDAFETIALVVSVLLVNFAISDGRTNYLEGFVMMMAYVAIALVCWFYDPENTSGR